MFSNGKFLHDSEFHFWLTPATLLSDSIAYLPFQVRNADSSWRDTRKTLRKDHRWELVESLDRDEKEKLFDQHIDALVKKNKEMFHKLLDETSEVRFFHGIP
jgi:hypothetical protein